MVPCFSNTSQAFPMMNELSVIVSEFYKCDCQDMFFDYLCPELNLDGVVYFYQNVITTTVQAIERHFEPAEQALKKVSNLQSLDGPIMNVLKKTYQSNWKSIHAQCLPNSANEQTMQRVQSVLSIADDSQAVNDAIVEFVQKVGEVAFQTVVCEPQLVFDIKRIGEKVQFN